MIQTGNGDPCIMSMALYYSSLLLHKHNVVMWWMRKKRIEQDEIMSKWWEHGERALICACYS